MEDPGGVQNNPRPAHLFRAGRLFRGMCAAWWLLAAATPGAAADVGSPWSGLAGSWQAADSDSVVRRLELEAEGEGFRIRVAYRAGGEFSVAFVPGKRRGIFRPVPEEGLFGMFTEASTNPLESGHLEWARTDGRQLVVYRLRLPSEGDFTLDRLALQGGRGELRIGFQRRSHAGPPVEQNIEMMPED